MGSNPGWSTSEFRKSFDPHPALWVMVPAWYSVGQEQLLTIAEAARIARVHAFSIKRAYRSGQLKIFRLSRRSAVRIHPDSLKAWIDAHSSGGAR